MIGKNPLWVAKQHGHSVQTMLDTYAAWTEGAKDSDVEAIRQAMESTPRAGALAVNSGEVVSDEIAATDQAVMPVARIEANATAEAVNSPGDTPASPGICHSFATSEASA